MLALRRDCVACGPLGGSSRGHTLTVGGQAASSCPCQRPERLLRAVMVTWSRSSLGSLLVCPSYLCSHSRTTHPACHHLLLRLLGGVFLYLLVVRTPCSSQMWDPCGETGSLSPQIGHSLVGCREDGMVLVHRLAILSVLSS